MKKIISFIVILFCSFAIFSQTLKKTITIDALYKIELNFDKTSSTLNLNLLSDNSEVFDENYAEDCIEETLKDFLEENSFSNAELSSSIKDFENNSGKYTSLNKKYHIE